MGEFDCDTCGEPFKTKKFTPVGGDEIEYISEPYYTKDGKKWHLACDVPT